MSTTNYIQVFEAMVDSAKFRERAGNLLGHVRRISEHDMQTLERIIDSYLEMVRLVREKVDYRERVLLDGHEQVPEILKALLERRPTSWERLL
jgi:hypothetical protein